MRRVYMGELTAMIRALLAKTEQGKLRWQTGEHPHELRAQLTDGTSFELTCDTSAVGIVTRGVGGAVIAPLTATQLGAFMPNEAVLRALATAATRSAADRDAAEQAVLEAVRTL